MKAKLIALTFLGLALSSAQSQAKMLIWQDNSLTYLYGWNFEVDPERQQTITYEHASGWKWGDLFWMVDYLNYNGGKTGAGYNSSYWTEFSPRLSFGKLSGKQINAGPITDVLLAMTYEQGRGDIKYYLAGPGFDLDIPGFDFFQLNFYYRHGDDPATERGPIQITPAWSITWPLGNSTLTFAGYIDWVINDDDDVGYKNNFHLGPQLRYDLGKALLWGEKQLYVGIDYDYWTNKYGIEDGNFGLDTNQSAPSLFVRAHF